MEIKQTRQFERQLNRLVKKHYPVYLIKKCIHAIVENDVDILKRIKDHSLRDNWRGYRKFHPSRLENDGSRYDKWIVVYRMNSRELILTLVATGDHELLNQ